MCESPDCLSHSAVFVGLSDDLNVLWQNKTVLVEGCRYAMVGTLVSMRVWLC